MLHFSGVIALVKDSLSLDEEKLKETSEKTWYLDNEPFEPMHSAYMCDDHNTLTHRNRV